MLIQALCNYYDILLSRDDVIPETLSPVDVSFLVSLTPGGKIDEIISLKRPVVNSKGRERFEDRKIIMPVPRTNPSTEFSNLVEYRGKYIFGLDYDSKSKTLTPAKNNQGKLTTHHVKFKETALKFIESMDSPVINAYRNFVMNWNPVDEVANEHLLGIGKEFTGSTKFVFCLTGFPEQFLHDEPQIQAAWLKTLRDAETDDDRSIKGQCAITGSVAEIARLHDKISGVRGGQTSGTSMISFNNDSENSYGKEQSFNSNISKNAMQKYTEVLNKLLGDDSHKTFLDEMTIVHWAMAPNNDNDDIFNLLLGQTISGLGEEETNALLNSMFKAIRAEGFSSKRLSAIRNIDPDVDFYIVGITPNAARLSIKFLYRRRFGAIIENIVRFQNDLQMEDDQSHIKLKQIRNQFISPFSSKATMPNTVGVKLFESMVYNKPLSTEILQIILRRVKTDNIKKTNEDKGIYPDDFKIRMGLIKTYLNRQNRLNHEREEITMSLNQENMNQAYLCGRLFAILEKLQQDSSTSKLNRTIRNSYFSTASSKPAIVFPKLIRLAQNHLNKLSEDRFKIYYCKKINEVVNHLDDEFPNTLSLVDQGRFAIGYFQQNQFLYTPKAKRELDTTEETETEE